MSGPTNQDLADEGILDEAELGSDGTSAIFSGATTVSTTNATSLVTLSGVDLFRTERLENGDKITLSGTTAADGTYTVDAVQSITTFTVQEAIADSTGGTCTAVYTVGAGKIGFDPSGLVNTTSTNVQDAISDIDAAVSAGGETNTASNVGGQVEVFKQKTGVNFEFRTLEEDGGLNISQETNTVKLSTGFRRNFLLMGS